MLNNKDLINNILIKFEERYCDYINLDKIEV